MSSTIHNSLSVLHDVRGVGSRNSTRPSCPTGVSEPGVEWIQGGCDEVLWVNNTKYIAPHHHSDHQLGLKDGSWLVTVIALPDHIQVTEKWLSETINRFIIEDDVWVDNFLTGVIFQGASEGAVTIEAAAKEYLRKKGNQWINFTLAQILPGPYVKIGDQLRDVWKLDDDFNGTAMTVVRPQICPSDVYEPSHVLGTNGKCLSFPIRSRLKTYTDLDSPIKGWRIIIKDNIDLNGIVSTIGNRAYGELYSSRSATAESVQRVIQRGVIVHGKSKMTSFGNWEEPVECIDYQAPWNPRGDGYQSPGGWGSITRPALWCGCFGLRPTPGAASTQGIEPSIPIWDTPGILARDLVKLRTFSAEWLDDVSQIKNARCFSAVVWLTDFWSTIEPEQAEIARRFLGDIQTHFCIEPEDISLVDEWDKHPPKDAEGQSLMEYISPAMMGPAYDSFHSQTYFHDDYARLYGRRPYTSPRNEQSCDMGRQVTKEQRDASFAKISTYAQWVKKTILSGERSNALILFPQEDMVPRYRDEVPTFRRPPQPGISSLAFAALLESPALAIPLDQIPYASRVTGTNEYLPFVVTLLSPPGTDLSLLEAALDILRSSGRPTSVSTGKVMFKGQRET